MEFQTGTGFVSVVFLQETEDESVGKGTRELEIGMDLFPISGCIFFIHHGYNFPFDKTI